MIRSIAKLLIQYFYDSSASPSVPTYQETDPLPRWLRYWATRDLRLAEFERELGELERKLVSQSAGHLKSWNANNVPAKCSMIANSSKRDTLSIHPIAMAALAAGFSGVLVTAGWYCWNTGSGAKNFSVDLVSEASKREPLRIEVQSSAEQVRREQLMRSTWDATKRMASGWKQKSGQANQTLAFVNQSILEQQIREVGGKGLRFFAQKLPQATVRMLGLNAARVGNTSH